MRKHMTQDGQKREPVTPSACNYYRKTLNMFSLTGRRGV